MSKAGSTSLCEWKVPEDETPVLGPADATEMMGRRRSAQGFANAQKPSLLQFDTGMDWPFFFDSPLFCMINIHISWEGESVWGGGFWKSVNQRGGGKGLRHGKKTLLA